MADFVNKLIEYSKSGAYPMHMPGHKRRTLTFEPDDAISRIRAIDITEVEGFDNLNAPEGIIKDMEERVARLFGVPESAILLNGSTGGNLAAITACVKRGGTILMARNSHISAYNGAAVNGLKCRYVYPAECGGLGINGGIDPEDVRTALEENPDIQAVFITSPTYEGIISDVRAIADIAHEAGIPLIVDEAHGAHMGMYAPFAEKYGMECAIKNGADIAVQSLHKTLPSFTQTAVIHYAGDLIDRSRLKRCLATFQSSSPSYILMAGVERCLDILENRGGELFAGYEENLKRFYESLGKLRNIWLLKPEDVMGGSNVKGMDIGKLVFFAPRGRGLYDTLINEYGIQPEMYGRNFCLAMTSIMDNSEGFDALSAAIRSCDEKYGAIEHDELRLRALTNIFRPKAVMDIHEALDGGSREGKDPDMICRNFVFAYPPGVPVMVPGELFTDEIFSLMEDLADGGIVMRYL